MASGLFCFSPGARVASTEVAISSLGRCVWPVSGQGAACFGTVCSRFRGKLRCGRRAGR